MRQAHEQQRRLERDGGDGVDGGADGAAVATTRADDAHAGGEVAHDGAHVVLGRPHTIPSGISAPTHSGAPVSNPGRSASATTGGSTALSVCPSRSALESMYGSDSGCGATSIGTWSETCRP